MYNVLINMYIVKFKCQYPIVFSVYYINHKIFSVLLITKNDTCVLQG